MSSNTRTPGPIEQSFEEIDYDLLQEIESYDYYLGENDWDDCNLSDADLNLCLTPPNVETWKDFSSSTHPSIFTLDDAKKKNWELAQEEILHVKARIGSAYGTSIDGLSKEQINHMVCMKVLGPTSDTGTFLRAELCLSEEKYLAFMTTFFIQAAYRVSVTELYGTLSLLKDKIPLSREEYLDVWNSMATKKRIPTGTIRSPRSDSPLWQGQEAIVNTELKKISIAGREGRIAISLDDDKIWFACINASRTDLFDIKYSTHTRANRKGAVAHSAISTGHMIPLQICFERSKDSAITCMRRMLDNLFGSSGRTDLQNVDVHSDRGYMIKDVVDYFLENGANFVGTIKRIVKCWPFTYNQNINPEKDKRTLVSLKGHATLFLKYCQTGPRATFASAFRNGSQAVSTALSSMHRGHQWDGIVWKPSERFAWEEDNEALIPLFFQKVTIDSNYEFDESDIERGLLQASLDTKIVPQTLRQGTADWHWLRKFSLTSSQAHHAFLKAIPIYHEDEAWGTVAKYLYGQDWRQVLGLDIEESSDEDEEPDNGGGGDDATNIGSLADYLESVVLDDTDEQRFALGWLVSKVSDDDVPPNENDAKEEWKDLSFAQDRRTTSKVKAKIQDIILCYDPFHLDRKEKLTSANIVQWMQSPNAVREVMFYKSASLKEIMRRKKLIAAPGSGSLNLTRMIGAISGTNLDGIEEDTPSRDTQSDSANPSHCEATIKAILEKSFLNHQKGARREDCNMGHRLELPILRKFVKNITNVPEYNGIQVRSAYTAGLAAKKGELYAKDSIDFVLAVEDPKTSERKLWGFEAKGRVSNNTAAAEQQNLMLNANPHLRIQDTEVSDVVVKVSERFQVLQHAYVYDFDTVVLAVSDSQSELIRSYVIDFTPELREDFGKVLSQLKELTLDWAYPEQLSSRNDVLPIPEEVMKVSEQVPSINGIDTLQGTVNLWHTLRKLPLPLPSLRRLIPAICAYWNAVKGGSDTTTKLMDDCILQIPRASINMETVAMTRLLQILMVFVHRIFQCTTNRKPVEEYPSLLHWRSAATERMTFHKSLLMMSNCFKKELEGLTVPAVVSQIPRTPVLEPIRRRARRARVEGIVPIALECAPTLSSKTPAKMNRQVKSGTASTEVLQMVYRCVGMPMQVFPAKADYKCVSCGKNTSWYCAGCKRWFCFTATKKNVGELYYHSVRGKEKNFVKSCFHQNHTEAWGRYFDAADSPDVISMSSSDSSN